MDPRPANEILFDIAVQRAHFFERFKNGVVRSDFMNELEGNLHDAVDTFEVEMGRLARVPFGDTGLQRKTVQKAISRLEEKAAAAYAALKVGLDAVLVEETLSSVLWARRALVEASIVEIDVRPPSKQALRSIRTSQPFRGRYLREWYRKLESDNKARSRGIIREGVMQGRRPSVIARELRSRGITKSRREAETVARTATHHVSTRAQKASYDANKELVKGERWVSVLDSRTSTICASLDGEVYDLDKGPRPPAHFNCRSVMVPVLRSWRELGIDLDDAPVGTRASMNGEVPANETYGAWLKRQPRAIQDDVLGKGKAALFRRGKVPITRFTDSNLRPLTLAELRALESRAIARAA